MGEKEGEAPLFSTSPIFSIKREHKASFFDAGKHWRTSFLAALEAGPFDVGEGGRKSLCHGAKGSPEGIKGKPEPKMKPKAGKELHIRDLEDGSTWTIRDEEIVELIKKHHAAPDQKTKDEILKILQSKIASSSNAAEASRVSKQLIQESKGASGPEMSKISAELQKLKLKGDSKASVGKKDGDSKANKVNKKK
ncbi:hypothetical protein COCNU_03G000810 [Cocos nucifera]|uniref:Uncharacterized protein n=1 Tax=Cocos nucifera TaxID=13894 RepID=A0A8K0I174_COCNU|nr:hypothetical protein COCNU_03G000810 [Cocos nucifera]